MHYPPGFKANSRELLRCWCEMKLSIYSVINIVSAVQNVNLDGGITPLICILSSILNIDSWRVLLAKAAVVKVWDAPGPV